MNWMTQFAAASGKPPPSHEASPAGRTAVRGTIRVGSFCGHLGWVDGRWKESNDFERKR